MSRVEESKRRAAEEALKIVRDGYVVGLGSGSTAAYFIEGLGRLVREEGLRVLGVATSYQSLLLAIDNGVPLTTLNEHPEPDIAVDGVDEINRHLEAIKGGGGAMTMEKVVGSAAKRLVVVADESKVVERLGETQPVPVEVLPAAHKVVALKIRRMGAEPTIRMARGKVGPVVTDNGNFILDIKFHRIEKPKELDSNLKSIPGVVETGIFADIIEMAIIGRPEGVYNLTREKTIK